MGLLTFVCIITCFQIVDILLSIKTPSHFISTFPHIAVVPISFYIVGWLSELLFLLQLFVLVFSSFLFCLRFILCLRVYRLLVFSLSQFIAADRLTHVDYID